MLARLKHINVFFKDPDKKPFFKILIEFIHFAIMKRTLPIDYFRKFLYRKDIKNYASYLSLKEYYSIIESPKMVFPEISLSLENKLKFYFICKENNIPTPVIFCHNYKNKFILNKSEIHISNINELNDFFEHVFISNKLDELFVKPIDGIGGSGCIKLNKQFLKKQLVDHGKILLDGNYVYQEVLKQHSEINRIHSKSINSIRIDTYIDNHKTPHVLSSIMRFGIGNNITDNIHTGGFYISLNQLGQLQQIGRQDFIEGGGVFKSHPDSKYVLEGFQVPYYNESCKLVLLATKYFPNRIIGWDIAITEYGPVIIEGNHNPSLHVTDVAYGGYKKHPFIMDILKEIKYK
jgi:hypothetical protein